jgi:hypothetical protein
MREGIAALIANQKDMCLLGKASNGREAIEQFRSHRPDVTLMHLLMPEMNGIERSRVSDLSQIGMGRCWPLFAPWRTMAREETVRLFVHKSL